MAKINHEVATLSLYTSSILIFGLTAFNGPHAATTYCSQAICNCDIGKECLNPYAYLTLFYKYADAPGGLIGDHDARNACDKLCESEKAPLGASCSTTCNTWGQIP